MPVEIHTAYLPSGSSKKQFLQAHSAIIHKFYLPGTTRQAQMSSPVDDCLTITNVVLRLLR